MTKLRGNPVLEIRTTAYGDNNFELDIGFKAYITSINKDTNGNLVIQAIDQEEGNSVTVFLENPTDGGGGGNQKEG